MRVLHAALWSFTIVFTHCVLVIVVAVQAAAMMVQGVQYHSSQVCARSSSSYKRRLQFFACRVINRRLGSPLRFAVCEMQTRRFGLPSIVRNHSL